VASSDENDRPPLALSPHPLLAFSPSPPPQKKTLKASTASSKAAILHRLREALKSSKAAAAAASEDPRRALASALLAAASSSSSSALPASLRTPERRVPGCASAAWIDATLVGGGGGGGELLTFRSAADAALTRGAAAVLCSAASGASPAAVAALTAAEVAAAGLSDESLLAAGGGLSNRAGGAASLLASLKSRARAAVAVAASPSSSAAAASLSPFPSLIVGASGRLEPRGAFAEAQARFLKPDRAVVRELAKALREKKVGVVAHFYMDPEVQGCLAAVAENARKGNDEEGWPHVKISDSLAMADAAVAMAEAGCRAVAVLGVDFMSENVRAILDAAGLEGVDVLRMSADEIGCTLADAADDAKYNAWLRQRGGQRAREEAEEEGKKEGEEEAPEAALHVVYINTSLRAKAAAHAAVPTVTCTSSNVVATVLQASAQVPEGVRVLYGPDSLMGANLKELLSTAVAACEAEGTDAAARRLHPLHTAQSLRRTLRNLDYFREGACAVHHMFGGTVPATVEALYGDAAVAAHFEVPGELFRLALRAQRERPEVGGVVGSTQNILDFILGKVDEAVARAKGAAREEQGREEGEEGGAPAAAAVASPLERVRVILGTESGMATSIVNAVSARLAGLLSAAGLPSDAVDVEVIFPVSADAVTTAETISSFSGPSLLPGGLAVIPGPASGEGCSAEGGCASCPYMKMNTLSALLDVCACVGGSEGLLAARRATRHGEALSSVVVGAGGGESEGTSAASSSSATVAEVGCAPILHMRHFQRTGVLSDELVADIRGRRRRTT